METLNESADTPQCPQQVPLPEASASDGVSPGTIVAYLIGNERAILKIAHCRNSVGLGALLVLSAGFAREYDGEDLLHEPWHLLIPHAASVVTAFLLYSLVRLIATGRTKTLPGFFAEFPAFLGLYWMTAPLAWIYAIPFERRMSPGDAMHWNLQLLGYVSVWRVVLITRVIYVVYGARPLWTVIVTVLLFGDAVMLAAIRFLPVPVLHFMGGVRLTESESILQMNTMVVQLIGYPCLLLLLLTQIAVFVVNVPWSPIDFYSTGHVRRSTWIVATLAVLMWLAVLPHTQPEQQRRHLVERKLLAGRISDALRFMSAHTRTDFPPHWSPPPHIALSKSSPSITDVITVVLSEPPADWVRDVYMEAFRRALPAVLTRHRIVNDQDLLTYLNILDQLPVQEWYSDDDWRSQEVTEFLQNLVSDKDRKLPPDVRSSLKRVVGKVDAMKALLRTQPAPAVD